MRARTTFPAVKVDGAVLSQLLLKAPNGRVPLDVALQLAAAVTRAVSEAHQRGKVFGGLDVASIGVRDDGTVTVIAGRASAPEAARGQGATTAADVHAVGSALFQILTGLTVGQARAREAVVRLEAPPPPSHFNPAVDECLDGLVLSMLVADPQARPSVGAVQELLGAAMEELGVEPSAPQLAAWLMSSRPKAKPVLRHLPPAWADDEGGPDDTLDDEDDDFRPASPTRGGFDGWTVSALAFGAAALLLAMRL